MKRVVVDDLPPEPLAAAGVFHQHWLPHVEALLAGGEDVLVALGPADHTHREWRRAIAAGLARAHAPRRVNVIAGEAGEALHACEDFLSRAEGVTGHYLEVDANGAGEAM